MCEESHVPYGYRADSTEDVLKMLDACQAPLDRLATLIIENPSADDGQIRELFNEPDLTINVHVVAAMRATLENGSWK